MDRRRFTRLAFVVAAAAMLITLSILFQSPDPLRAHAFAHPPGPAPAGHAIVDDQNRSTFDRVVRGAACRRQSFSDSIECNYRVGRSLHVSIAGVGASNAAITFMKSDFDGDYYGSIGVEHGCVIVKPGVGGRPFDYAFISPRSGKVYRNWQDCRRGM